MLMMQLATMVEESRMNDQTVQELYPCGVRVSVLSLGTRTTNHPVLLAENKRLSAKLLGGRKGGSHSVTPPFLKRSSKRNSIADMLQMRINFADDIVETRCPETVSYSNAKKKLDTFMHRRDRKHSLQQVKAAKERTPKRRSLSDVSEGKQSFKLHQQCPNITSAVPEYNPHYSRSIPVLQTVFPKPLSEWTEMGTAAREPIMSTDTPTSRVTNRIIIGSRRWISMPTRAPTPPQLQLRVIKTEPSNDVMNEGNSAEDIGQSHSVIDGQSHSMIGHGLNNSADDLDSAMSTASSESIMVKKLLIVFHKLMSSWKIFVQPQHLTTPYCTRCLSSPNGGKQLYGLYIARKIFLQSLLSNPVSVSHRRSDEAVVGVAKMDDDMFDQICKLLEAETERVRVAAAILLHCWRYSQEERTNGDQQLMNRISHALLSSISSSSHSERWSAVQSLAITGICNMGVVTALFDYYCNSRSESDKEKSLKLLVELSLHSKLVVSLLAEKLNSKCWNERRSTCVLFPLLQHPLNKDVTDRILNSALRDWNPQVRIAAAQALGKTNNGKMVHDAIKQDLTDSDEITKLNALKQLHLLGLMTATLLPLFVQCFKDDHNSIKLEAISIAEDLEIMDESVISALTQSLQDDCWKVKAHAIKAVGTLKIVSDSVISHLLWAARFEQLPEVRAQVCNTIAILGVKNEQIVMALKAILNVEDNELVLNEARRCLKIMGEDATPFDHMLDIVCAEVKQLSTKEGILEQIVNTEKSEFVEGTLSRQKAKLQQISNERTNV